MNRVRWLNSPVVFYLGLLLFLLLLFSRLPMRLEQATFIMDDGFIYFIYAYTHHWFDALTAQHHGYYNLWANLVTVFAANLMPLEQAAYAGVALGYVFWLLLAALVVSPASPFSNPLAKTGALLVALLAMPWETMMIACMAHFFFAAAAALIVVSTPATRRGQAAYVLFLLLCGLSSPVALFLWPVYVWAYFRNRSPYALALVATLSIAVIVQLLAFYHSQQYLLLLGGAAESQAITISQRSRFTMRLDMLVFWIFNNAITLNFLGEEASTVMAGRCAEWCQSRFRSPIFWRWRFVFRPALPGCGCCSASRSGCRAIALHFCWFRLRAGNDTLFLHQLLDGS